MSFGIITTGFNPKTLDDIKADLEAAFRSELGATVDLSSEGPLGQIIGVMAERYAELWELGQSAYAAATPDGAVGAALEAVAAITGTLRAPATNSTVTLTATGTPGTVVAAGKVATVVTVGTRFVTTESGTITLAEVMLDDQDRVVGERVYDPLSNNVYECTVAGHNTDANISGTGSDIIDGGGIVHWKYIGPGPGVVDIVAEAEDTGPLQGLSGTINVIATPVAGWSAVVNLLDADLGTDLETDAALRLRREDELRQSGNAALDPIRAALLQLDGVTSVTVFENVDDTTDGDGVPPHSIEALVRGGDDDEIRAALFANVAAGIYTHGTTSGTVEDSEGVSHTVRFTRPTSVNIYVIIDVLVDASLYPADGDAQIKAAVVAFGDAQKGGKDAVASSIGAQAFLIPGVLDVATFIDVAPGPTLPNTIPISTRQLAVFDTSRITVSALTGTP